MVGRDGDGTAVQHVGFSRAGSDALDQGLAFVAEDHDVAGGQFSILAQTEDETAFWDRRLHRCGRNIAQEEDGPKK